MPRWRRLFGLVIATGCALPGRVSNLEHAQATARALDTFHDFEIAREASAANLAELEGLHETEPDNEELLLSLVRACADSGTAVSLWRWSL